MKKTLSDILNEFNTDGLTKEANAIPGIPVQQAPVVPTDDVVQPQAVPAGSPAELEAAAEQEAMMQAQSEANAANAAVAAQKAKEDAITNAASMLVAAEQDKQQALNTLNQVAGEAIANENMAIAKEASAFGTIAGEAMADAFYNRAYLQNTINDIYSNAYSAVDNHLDKQASYSLDEDTINMLVDNAYSEVDNFIYKSASFDYADDAYDEVSEYLDNL